MYTRTLSECLTASDTMGRIAAHAERLRKFQCLLIGMVPTQLTSACRVANFRAGSLIVYVENGAAATKLRQMIPTLTEAFHLKTGEVIEILVKVQPSHAAPQHEQRKLPSLSNAGTASFLKLAESLSSGPLRSALNQLLKRED